MNKNMRVIETLAAGAILLAVVIIIACQASSTNTNTNTNTNESDYNVAKSIDISQAEPRIVGICRTYADKIILLCNDSTQYLSEWQKKAMNDKNEFVAECVSDDVFQSSSEEDIDKIETQVNQASACNEIAESL